MARRPVLHYTISWLPLTERFVAGQVANSRYRSVVVSRGTPRNTDEFPHPRIHSLDRLERVRHPLRRARLTTAALEALTRVHGTQLVHAQFAFGLSDLAGLMRRRSLPFVVSVFGNDVLGFRREHPSILERGLPLADVVIVPSQFLAEAAVASGADPAVIRVAPPGIDTQFFHPTPLTPDPVVTFIGRFVDKKGLDVLLEAWPVVRRAVRDARLEILGLGDTVPAAAHQPGVVVTIGGGKDRVRAAIQATRVIVSPSRTAANSDAESLLLVNVEAQASGRPVVTTRHGGIPEFVDEGTTALLVEEADPDGLAAALIEVLSDDELALRLGEAGPRWAARFDVAACAARVDEIYDELLG